MRPTTGDSRQAFRELTDLNTGSPRPVLLYLTTSDEEMAPKLEAYETAVLTNEKVSIASKFFDCYQVDVEEINETHPLRGLIDKPKPLTIYTLHKGKILSKTKEKPSTSHIFSACARALKKSCGVSLEEIAKKEEQILDELDDILAARQEIDRVRLEKGKKLTSKEDEALRKREQELFEREAALMEAERKLLSLEEFGTPENEPSPES